MLSSGAAALAAPPGRFVKSICSMVFPKGTPLEEKLGRARDAGFQAIELRWGDEIPLEADRDTVRRSADLARKAGVAVACLWASSAVQANPLNSPDPAVRAKGVDALRRAVEVSSWLGCGAILVVPGRLGSGARFQVGYQDTWDRTTAELRKAVPYAERAKVTLCMENVWNKFLVSPMEMRAFVDQFRSPSLQVQFDIGNVMQFGYPQDWILTLGPRIKRVHLKDFKLSSRSAQGTFVPLMEGDVDWKEVMAALVKVGYRGFLSPEVGPDPNDPDLRKLSATVDKILALA